MWCLNFDHVSKKQFKYKNVEFSDCYSQRVMSKESIPSTEERSDVTEPDLILYNLPQHIHENVIFDTLIQNYINNI